MTMAGHAITRVAGVSLWMWRLGPICGFLGLALKEKFLGSATAWQPLPTNEHLQPLCQDEGGKKTRVRRALARG